MFRPIDMHCDTLMLGILQEKKGGPQADLMKMSGMVDFERMIRGNYMAQFFAVWMLPPGHEKWFGCSFEDEEYINAGTKIFNQSVAAHQDIVGAAKNADEIRRNFLNGKISAVLTMEDGRAVDGKLENIKKFYDAGYRALSIIWNNENCFAYPNAWDAEAHKLGLKPFGKEAIQYMQELGMLVDVSHLNKGGFFDCVDILKKPIVATHSNARALCNHKRNLTDEQLVALAKNGGITGINFGPEFSNSETQTAESNDHDIHQTAAQLARHARYIADKAGIATVALGTDFDGISGDLEIGSCDKMYILENALRKEGFTEADLDAISYRNALRVMDEAMK